MKLKSIVFTISIFFGLQSIAQENFQRMYNFGDERSIQDVYVTDSCYYFTGSRYISSTDRDAIFGKMKLNGDIEYLEIDTTANVVDWQKWGRTQLQKNYRGNLITSYMMVEPNFNMPYIGIKEYNLDGSVLDLVNVDPLLSDSVQFRISMKLIAHNSDSTYIALTSYEDLTPAYSNPATSDVREIGAMVLKINLMGDTIWTKRFKFNWSSSSKPSTRGLDIEFLNDSLFMVSVFEEQQTSPYNSENKWGRIRYYKMNIDGDILDSRLFNDGKYLYGSSGFLVLEDGTFIQGYGDARLNDDNFPDYEAQGVLANVGRYNNILWKDSLIDLRSDFLAYASPTILRFADSTSFVGAHTWYVSDTSVYPNLQQYARIFKRKITGEVIWERNYQVGSIDSIRADYIFVDLELTPDGGYIASGTVRVDLFNPYSYEGEFPYVLKTNCLGFIDDPIASFEAEVNENLNVVFINTSQNGGSFEWDFGDYTGFNLGEGYDTITHKFSGFGPYTVTLVANGCQGARDTFSIEVNPVNHFDPQSVMMDQGQFLIFPNPAFAGSGLLVYLNDIDLSEKDVFVDLYSIEGKRVTTIQLSAQQGIYQLDEYVGAGCYYAILRKGDSILEQEKLVIY